MKPWNKDNEKNKIKAIKWPSNKKLLTISILILKKVFLSNDHQIKTILLCINKVKIVFILVVSKGSNFPVY